MNYIKKSLMPLFVILVFISLPFAYTFFIFGEKVLYTKYMARFLNRVDKLGTKFFYFLPFESLKEAFDLYEELTDNISLEQEFLEMQTQLSIYKNQYLNYIKSLWYLMLTKYDSYKKHELLVSLNLDSSIPFYRDIFRFLLDYMDDYRILPGIIPLDSNELLHVKIQIVGIKEHFLTVAELKEHFSIRLTNALSQNNELINIPSGYWDNATYFPNLESNIKNGYIIAYIALSIAGKEEILRIKNSERQAVISSPEE